MKTSLHSINIDFSHSSEPKVLIDILRAAPTTSMVKEEVDFLCTILGQLNDAAELLESLEV